MKHEHWTVMAAAAVALLTSPVSLAAGTITVLPAGPYTYSREGLVLAGSAAVTLPDIVITLGNNLTYQDDVYLRLPGAVPLPAVVTPTLVTCASAGAAMGYVTTVDGGWAFRVTSVAGVTLGDTCTFSGLEVQGASLVVNDGVLEYRAIRFSTGALLDFASASDEILITSQFAVTVQHALDGVIDVYKDRLAFAAAETVPPGAAAPWPDQADTLNFTTTRDAAATVFTGPTVTTRETRVRITGDFAWVDGIDPGATCEAAEFSARIPGLAAAYTIDTTSSCQELVLTSAAASGTTSATSYFYVPRTAGLEPTDYVGSVTWEYALASDGDVTGTKAADWDPGAWSINGALVYVQYMPYDDGISRVVYAANRSIFKAGVTVDVYHDGNHFFCRLDAIPARAVTQLSAALDACVADKGIASGRVAFLLTFRAADHDIEVYSAYNVGGSDRGTVVNTGNGRRFFYGLGH